MSFFEELKRRNVVRVGIAYAVASWLILQVADIMFELLGAPDWSMRMVAGILVLGLPLALIFAWAFELTPEGIKRESEVDRSESITQQTGRKLDFAIIGILVIALGYFAYDKFVLRTGTPDVSTDAAQIDAPAGEVPLSTLPTDRSIAVLPFENRSNREEDEFFTSGIHDDLLTQLAQISSLRVISRTSVAQFEDTDKSIREIAELLNVATILEGGVQRAGDQVRINLQLIDAATDAHLWAATYDRELTANNIFAIQSEITTEVTEAMRATLSPEEAARIADVPTENLEALEEYFKGKAEMDTRTLPSIESARMRFERARTLDPEFALAWAGEAQAILLLNDSPTSYGDIPSAEVIRLARPLMETAYELAPNEPYVLAVYGLLENNADNPEEADDYYSRSLAIDPNNGEVLNWKRINMFSFGEIKESWDIAIDMVDVDPLSMITLYNGIWSLSTRGDGNPVRVEQWLTRLESIDPSRAADARGTVEELSGNLPGGARHYFEGILLAPGNSSLRGTLGDMLARLDLYDESLKVDPEALDYLPFYRGDWKENVRIAREDQARSPDGVAEASNLISALVWNGEFEEAMERADALWERESQLPFQMGPSLLDMAVAARRTEHPAQAESWRSAQSDLVRRLIEADLNVWFRYYAEARMAAYDGRDADALAALTRAVDKGLRWRGWFDAPYFDDLRGDLAFQAERARMEELATEDRRLILELLCSPDSELEGWEPAPETCVLYRDLRRPSSGAPT